MFFDEIASNAARFAHFLNDRYALAEERLSAGLGKQRSARQYVEDDGDAAHLSSGLLRIPLLYNVAQ
jgi:hypothetical protein